MVAHELAEFFVGGGFEFGAGDAVVVIGETHLAADGGGGAGVVAGDHFNADTRLATGLEGGDGLGARRVDNAHEAEENEASCTVGIEIVEGEIGLGGAGVAPGGGGHAEAARGEIIDGSFPEGAIKILGGGAGDNTGAAAGGDEGAGVGHAGAVAHAGIGGEEAVDLEAGTDSPVRADSSMRRLLTSMRRRSAGTRSPDLRRTMSPGTRASASIWDHAPSRRAWAWRESILRMPSRACSALPS